MKRKALITLLQLSLFVWTHWGFAQECLSPRDQERILALSKASLREGCATCYRPAAGKTGPDSLISAVVAGISADTIESNIRNLVNFGTRFMLAPNRREVAEWIRQKFIGAGCLNTVLDSFSTVAEWPLQSGQFYTSWQYNVVATMTGTSDPGLEYVMGGHYDAIVYSSDPFAAAPGANDDASGIAAALETARAMNAAGFVPRSTVRFVAFAGEELGLFGSTDFVSRSLQEGREIQCMLNNDMISHDTSGTNAEVMLVRYDCSGWLVDMARQVCLNHTTLAPVIYDENSSASDSYPFYLAGYDPLFFLETDGDQNYHQLGDTAGNCNMQYCAQVTRLACGTLITATEVPALVNFDIFNPGTGNSLVINWKPVPNSDLTGYRVYAGLSPSANDTVFSTSDTTFTVSGLLGDTLYYIRVAAVNSRGYEGPTEVKTDMPVSATFDQGILIVDDSEGGILNPPDDIVDGFYRKLCSKFRFTEFDATLAGDVSLKDLGPYSSVLWHVNKQSLYCAIGRDHAEIEKYLKLGGNIMFTIYQPARTVENVVQYPAEYDAGSLMSAYANVERSEYTPGAVFNSAIPAAAGYPLLETDTMKNNYPLHHIPNIEALFPTSGGEVIYRFGTAYDTSTVQGCMSGLPVGIESKNSDPGVVMLSFPLYYMNLDQAKELVEYVMYAKFHESPLGETEVAEASGLWLAISPNPVRDQAWVDYRIAKATPVDLRLYNAFGETVNTLYNGVRQPGSYRLSFSTEDLAGGIYYCRLATNYGQTSLKLIVLK